MGSTVLGKPVSHIGAQAGENLNAVDTRCVGRTPRLPGAAGARQLCSWGQGLAVG